MQDFDDYTTDSMCETLEQLSRVGAFDYNAAAYVTLAGSNALRLRNNAGRAGLTGSLLAWDLWRDHMSATIALRKEQAA